MTKSGLHALDQARSELDGPHWQTRFVELLGRAPDPDNADDRAAYLIARQMDIARTEAPKYVRPVKSKVFWSQVVAALLLIPIFLVVGLLLIT